MFVFFFSSTGIRALGWSGSFGRYEIDRLAGSESAECFYLINDSALGWLTSMSAAEVKARGQRITQHSSGGTKVCAKELGVPWVAKD